jgi:hypothetical protein
VPNYQKFWGWLRVAKQKEDSKLNDFSPARLVGPFEHLPSCPFFLLPSNMATDQTDDEGNIKPRQTVNPGKSGDSRPFHGKCAPNSINGMTHTEQMPDITYFSLKALAREAATLQCTGEEIVSIADDAEAWYEQLGRLCYDTLLTHRWTSTRGIMRDPRNIFGIRGEPHQTQRVSFLLRYAGHREALKIQKKREEEGAFPPLSQAFIRLRRQLGNSGALFSNGWFFDDSGSCVTASFEKDFSSALQKIRNHFNVSMADGEERATIASMMALQAHAIQLRPAFLTDRHGIDVSLEALKTREFMQPSDSLDKPAHLETIERGFNLPIPDREVPSISDALRAIPMLGKSQAKKIREAYQNSRTGRVELEFSQLQGANKEERRELLKACSSEQTFYDMLNDQHRRAVNENRTTGSQKVHISAVCQWILFCAALGVSPYRWTWLLRSDMSAVQISKEDGLFSLFATFLSIKTTDKQAIENYLSAVRCFHADLLFLHAPEMPLTSRSVDLLGKQLLANNPTRRRRDILTPNEYRQVLQWWADLAQACEDNGEYETAHLYLSLVALVSCTFHGSLRTCHLAPGDEFSTDDHWTLSTLDVVTNMDPHGEVQQRVAIIPPPKTKCYTQSKIANERAQEGFAYELIPGEILSFPGNAKALLEHLRPDSFGREVAAMLTTKRNAVPAFFRVERKQGQCRILSLSREDVKTHLLIAIAATVPSGDSITISVHSGRKSANAAQQAAGIPQS